MRIVTANLCCGTTPEGTRGDLTATGRALLELDPDVVALQEIDHRQARSGFHPQLRHITAGLGWSPESCAMSSFFAGGARGVRLPSQWTAPHRKGRLARATAPLFDACEPALGGFGVALLTRWPVHAWGRLRLGAARPRLRRRDTAKWYRSWNVYWGQNRGLLMAHIAHPDGDVRVGATHLELGEQTATHQLRASWQAINRNWDRPAFLAGDFNMGDSLVRNVAGVSEANDATAPTFPRTQPTSQIDHVLTSPEVTVVACETHELPVGDHLALVVDVAW